MQTRPRVRFRYRMDDEEERPAAAFLDDLQIGEAAEEP
jgi:hypothetical protein